MRYYVIIITLCAIQTLLCSCTQTVHYNTFDELLASEEITNTSDDERETQNVLLWNEKEYFGGADFRRLSEYDHLSENIAEFATGYSWKAVGGTWYYPEGRDNYDILIFINNDGEASIWECIIIYTTPD